MREVLSEGDSLSKQRSVRIGRSGGTSAVATPLGDVLVGGEVLEL